MSFARKATIPTPTLAEKVVEKFGFRWCKHEGVFCVRSTKKCVVIEVDDVKKRKSLFPASKLGVQILIRRGNPAIAVPVSSRA
ncbi:MAG: hypothetical protein V4465_00970 [Patescibacteria group bacterium]